MKRCLFLIVFLWMLFGFAVFSSAAEKATKNDCVAKTREAAKMINAAGLEVTLIKINDKSGPFVWKDSYVFAIEAETAKLLAHPFVPPKMIGKSFKEITDKHGKAYFKEFLERANMEGKGWVDYVYPNPQGVISKKIAYVLSVPEEKVILIAGIYEKKADSTPLSSLKGKKAALILCFNGFDDNEYRAIKKSFGRLAIQPVVFSSKIGIAEGMHGLKIQTERSIKDFSAHEFEAAIFVGGRGLDEYLDNPKAHYIAREMLSKGKILAANYWAPVILANAGVLTGKIATVTPIEAQALRGHGANYVDKVLTTDGSIITGNGSAAAELYADLIVAKILIDAFR